MKQYVRIALSLLFLLLLLPGCSLVITDSAVGTVEPGAPGQPVEALETRQPTRPAEVATETPEPMAESLRPIPVEQVQILSGYASPIPALVSVSGTWPDLCAQLAQVSQPAIHDFQIEMTLLATPADPACPPDMLGLPFRMDIPINWMELAEGAYTVTVNGQQTTLYVPVIPPPPDPETGEVGLGVPLTPTPGAALEGTESEVPAGEGEAEGAPVPVPVEDVRMQVGVGSPIPVEVAVVAGWPSLCAQLAEVSQTMNGFQIDVNILAYPGRQDCPPDNVGYGFGLNIPINVVELPEGSYTVTVNGMATTLDVPVTPPAVEEETGGGQPEGTALCPEVARPAVVLFVPGENYLITNPLASGECYTTLDGDVPGNFKATAEGIYYPLLEGDQFVVKRLGYDGSASLLDFTAVERDDALLFHSFAVSSDGQRIAWAAAAAGGDSGTMATSSLWVASIDGSETVAPLPEYQAPSGQQRALVPVGFSEDNARLYYTLQPVGIGGSWASFVGRYDNLYMLQLNTDASPTLIFDCAEHDLFLCIGDFYEVAGQVSTLAYVDGTSVVILNGAGETLNTLDVAGADYVGYPTFGPGGELVFYSADLGDEDIRPEMGTIHRVAPPTAPAEVLASDRGLLPPQGWLDASHVIVGYVSGDNNWGTAMVGLDSSLQVLPSEPAASFVDVLPAPPQ